MALPEDWLPHESVEEMVLTDEESYQNDLNMLPYRFTTNSLFY
jgi:hypothetical protein